MANTGMTALGVSAIGAGALFIYSAFTKKSLFGKDGMIRAFIDSGSVEDAGKSVGRIIRETAEVVAGMQPSAVETKRPLNNKPPGA